MSFDDPNRQAVGLDPAWVEGTGGSSGEAAEPPAEPEAPSLDDMTKDELLAEADRRGIDADPSMTKAEIREAIG